MKKILLSLFVCVVSFISFGYCDNIYEFSRNNFTHNIYEGYFNFNSGTCLVSNSYMSVLSFYKSDGTFVGTGINGSNGLLCFDFDGYITSSSSTSRNYYYYVGLNVLGGSSSCPECPDCPVCDKTAHLGVYQGGQLIEGIDSSQGVYSLYLSDGLDFSYSSGSLPELYVSGSLCGSGSDLSGDLQYSNLYINNILHPGTQNIFVDIPDYITWDYATTGDDFNLYVGSGYDVDYINSVVDINSYRPTSGDFTNVFVSGLTLIMPYIVILLFIVFIWKFIKRIFK